MTLNTKVGLNELILLGHFNLVSFPKLEEYYGNVMDMWRVMATKAFLREEQCEYVKAVRRGAKYLHDGGQRDAEFEKLIELRDDGEYLEIQITGDSNDADYVTEVSRIDKDNLRDFMPLIAAIGDNDGEWPAMDYCRGGLRPRDIYKEFSKDIVDGFGDWCPYNIHRIVNIEVKAIADKQILI